MQKHTKIYFDYFGYDESDYITCEACDKYRAVSVHHIERRGMGGSKTKDYIENLMAVCNDCHIRYGDKKQYKDWLRRVHKLRMERVKK
jgi:hypothetical protein